MEHKQNKLFWCISILITLLFGSNVIMARTKFLSVEPILPLPTIYEPGTGALAFYVVTNNHSSIQNNIQLKGNFPEGLEQLTHVKGQSDICGKKFTLNPGRSCQLVLKITKPVQPSQLKMCAGYCSKFNTQLNVKNAEANRPKIAVGKYGNVAYAESENSPNNLKFKSEFNHFPGNAIGYNSDAEVYLMVGNHGVFGSSTDLLHWSYQTVGDTTLNLNNVIWDGHEFIAVGSKGEIVKIYDDKDSSVIHNSSRVSDLRSIAFHDNHYFAVGGNYILKGIRDNANANFSWTKVSDEEIKTDRGYSNFVLNSVAYGHGMFVVVGYSGTSGKHKYMTLYSENGGWSEINYDNSWPNQVSR